MERRTFAIRALLGMRDEVERKLKALEPYIRKAAQNQKIENLSIWGVEDVFFGYGEYDHPVEPDVERDLQNEIDRTLDGYSELLCPPGSMRLMYHDIGIVRQDKSLIRHRVFATRLKPGCAEEYKRRHDALIAARGDAVSEGPDSNFTIWYGAGYIFGYCEKVKSFDREMTPQEREDTIAWETRQLEIMDWLTDDVDWITGEKHEHIRRII
ncbi:MAG: L-rhamnose mutarotase [Clostridia bacterium]|nr:L-rhamnose mutarotase [Clostridia bacterium]